jgi:hypothetical protein
MRNGVKPPAVKENMGVLLPLLVWCRFLLTLDQGDGVESGSGLCPSASPRRQKTTAAPITPEPACPGGAR